MKPDVYLLELALTTFLCFVAMVDMTSNRTIDILMPGVTTHEEDEYWCTFIPAPEDETYIISFEALPDGDRAHHMILYSCTEPGSYEDKWHCHTGCKSGSALLFAWAFHAEPTHLPPDVGFTIGGSTSRYLTLQVHYRVIVKGMDHSGIRITVTPNRPQNTAGVLIMYAPSSEYIPPHKEKHHIDMSCQFHSNTPIYPFAFRVHAHRLGRVITGYQYNSSWHLLGKGNPQWPQAFFPVSESLVIRSGDYLVSRCTFNSMDQTKTVRIGMTHLDEMCNYYIMYYTKSYKGRTYYACGGNKFPELAADMPEGSDVALPPNPLLEDVAHGKLPVIEEVPNWPVGGPKLGQLVGVATDSHRNVHLFHRGTRVWDDTSFTLDNVLSDKDSEAIGQDVLLTLDEDGKVVDSWGKDMFYMPHGLHIDDKDNIWVTDVGLHQVMRFPVSYHKPDLILGTKMEPGSDSNHFCKPTDVATIRNGQFYVTDGYCNHRVMKFSADGKLMKEWGSSSSSLSGDGFPPPGDFNTPHSIAIYEQENILCVADRENRRIQCFDLEGNFLRQMHAPEITGKVFAVSFDPVTGGLYAINGKDVYKQVVTVEGFTFDARTGKLLQTWSPMSDPFHQAHDITVSVDGKAVYVTDISSNKIWKFSLTRIDGLHKPEKKSGHPPTIDDDDDDGSDEVLDDAGGSDFGASLIIGGLLIIPVFIIIIITVVLRLRKSGKLYYFFGNRNRNRRLNLGTLLSRGRHRFSPLSTEDKDPELDLLNSDPEIEEYSIMENKKA